MDLKAGLFFAYDGSSGLIDRGLMREIARYVDRFFELYAHVNLILGFVIPFGAILLLCVILFLLLKQHGVTIRKR